MADFAKYDISISDFMKLLWSVSYNLKQQCEEVWTTELET